MFTNFTKSDLRLGNIIIRRNGYVELLISPLTTLHCLGGGTNDLSNIKEDLTSCTGSDWDIMKVFKYPYWNQLRGLYSFFQNAELVYQRPIEQTEKQNIKEYEFDADNVEQFIKDVAKCLPDGDDEGFDDQWNKNGIQIIINNKKITVPMCCDALNELERSLKDMVNSWESGDPTEGNTVYLTEVDMVKELIETELENGIELSLEDCVEKYNKMSIVEIVSCYDEYVAPFYYQPIKLNTIPFNGIDRQEEFNQIINKIREELICTNIQEIFQENHDITFLLDCSLKLSGEFVDFYYGSPNKEDTKYYVDKYKKQKLNK